MFSLFLKIVVYLLLCQSFIYSSYYLKNICKRDVFKKILIDDDFLDLVISDVRSQHHHLYVRILHAFKYLKQNNLASHLCFYRYTLYFLCLKKKSVLEHTAHARMLTGIPSENPKMSIAVVAERSETRGGKRHGGGGFALYNYIRIKRMSDRCL